MINSEASTIQTARTNKSTGRLPRTEVKPLPYAERKLNESKSGGQFIYKDYNEYLGINVTKEMEKL